MKQEKGSSVSGLSSFTFGAVSVLVAMVIEGIVRYIKAKGYENGYRDGYGDACNYEPPNANKSDGDN